MTRFVLWGIPRGETDRLYERPLTERNHMADCKYVQTVAAADGWHSFRIQTLDGGMPDFARGVQLGVRYTRVS